MDWLMLIMDKIRYVMFGLSIFVFIMQYKRNRGVPSDLEEQKKQELKELLGSKAKPLQSEELEDLGEEYINTMIYHHKQQLKQFVEYDMGRDLLDYFVGFVAVILLCLIGYDIYIGDLLEVGLMIGFLGVNIYTAASYKESKWYLKLGVVLSKLHFEKQFPNKVEQHQELKELHRQIEPVKDEVVEKLDIKSTTA